MNAVDITTKDPWYTGLMDLPTAGYADGVMDADIKQLATNLKNSPNLYNQVEDWRTYIGLVGDPAWEGYSKFTPTQQKDYADKAKTVYTDAFNKWMEQAKLPTSVQTILSDDPTAKLPSYLSGYLALDPKDPKSVDAYRAQLKKDFGGLKTKDGSSYISNDLIDAVASGKESFDSLDSKVTSAAQTATNKSLGSSASQFSDITNSPTYKSLLNDPSKLTDSYNTSVAKLTKNATTGLWGVGTSGASGSDITGASGSAVGPNGEYQYNGGISQLLNTDKNIDPTLMANMVNSYNTQKGAWTAPKLNPTTGKLEADTTSPYAPILNGILANFKGDPYSAGYTSSLANKLPEAPNLTNIKTAFTDNPTSADLLKLANTTGTPYNASVKTSLSPMLSKMYQPVTTTNAAGQTSAAAKPGAPDTTKTVIPTTTIPAIDTKIPLTQINDTSTAIPEWKRLGYTSEAAYADDIAKKATADAKRIADEKAAADAAKQSGIAALNKSWVDHGNASYIDVGSKQELANYLAWNGPNHTYAINGQVVIDKGKVVDPSVAGLVTQTSSPDTTNLINQRNNALGFLKVNGDNPAMAAQIANAKAQLDGVNQQLQAIDPTLVTTYTPVDHAANIKSLQQQQQSIMAQMNNAKTDAELTPLQKQLAAVNGQMNFEDITKVAYWNPTNNPYLGTNPTTVVNNPVTNTVVDSGKSSAGNGIATNTGGFTSASNMNTNATGSNGASSIVSLLPGSPAPVNNTPQTIYGVDPNQVSLTMAPNINNSAPVNNTPQTIDLSGAANNPAVLNITNAQQQPVNNTPVNNTPQTIDLSGAVNNPAVLNMRAMGLIP